LKTDQKLENGRTRRGALPPENIKRKSTTGLDQRGKSPILTLKWLVVHWTRLITSTVTFGRWLISPDNRRKTWTWPVQVSWKCVWSSQIVPWMYKRWQIFPLLPRIALLSRHTIGWSNLGYQNWNTFGGGHWCPTTEKPSNWKRPMKKLIRNHQAGKYPIWANVNRGHHEIIKLSNLPPLWKEGIRTLTIPGTVKKHPGPQEMNSWKILPLKSFWPWSKNQSPSFDADSIPFKCNRNYLLKPVLIFLFSDFFYSWAL